MPFLYMLHPSSILIIPALLIAVWAQMRVKAAYKKYAQIPTANGLTGAAAAQAIMAQAGVRSVSIEPIPGEMTDHYDPMKKMLGLSHDVYAGNSIAAVGIAAHEVGHAIQDANQYGPMRLRHVIYPVSSLGSSLAFPLVFIGAFFEFAASPLLINVGIWLFTAAVAFTLVTLPVEFDASRRAVKALSSGGYLTQEELAGVRKVLNAAAMTYVAAAAVAILQLVRLLLIARGRN